MESGKSLRMSSMNFKSNCQIAIIALLGLACSAQSRSIAHLLEGIRNGDIASIYDAGRTGDPTFTPVLRDRLKQSDRDSERDALKMALTISIGLFESIPKNWSKGR